jgi:hypothetical protein
MNARLPKLVLGAAVASVVLSAAAAQAADRKVLIENFTADW